MTLAGHGPIRHSEVVLEKISVFQFEKFQDFLKYRLQKDMISSVTGRKKSNLQSVAKALGYNSPSTLSMILHGKRAPGESILNALFEYWGLSTKEKEYLRTIIQLEKAQKRGKSTSHILAQLQKFNVASTAHKINLRQFASMREWYYLVLKIMVACPDFREDPQWISAKLRRKVTASQLEKAIQTCLDLGMIERDPVTGKLVPKIGTTETTHDVPSEAIRDHHKGMMNRAIEAIDEQAIEARNFNSVTLRFDPAQMARAKQKLLDFAKEFNAEFESQESNEVFQLNLQFFSHTTQNLRSALEGKSTHENH